MPALRSGIRSGLDELRQSYLDLDTPSAVTEIALAALALYRPEPVPETVVHGDFRNGNLLISETGLEAVLDWELTHIGDPREDLGWLLVKCWRFGTTPEVGGFGTVDELLDGYAEIAGSRPDIEAVRWWQLYRTVWWSIVCAQMAQRHLSGRQRSVELAAIGRRVCEQEHDILLALGRPAGAVADSPGRDNRTRTLRTSHRRRTGQRGVGVVTHPGDGRRRGRGRNPIRGPGRRERTGHRRT